MLRQSLRSLRNATAEGGARRRGRAAPRASLGGKENELFGVPIIDRFPSLYLSYKNRLYKTRL